MHTLKNYDLFLDTSSLVHIILLQFDSEVDLNWRIEKKTCSVFCDDSLSLRRTEHFPIQKWTLWARRAWLRTAVCSDVDIVLMSSGWTKKLNRLGLYDRCWKCLSEFTNGCQSRIGPASVSIWALRLVLEKLLALRLQWQLMEGGWSEGNLVLVCSISKSLLWKVVCLLQNYFKQRIEALSFLHSMAVFWL
jgi:hypothetical protein